MEGCHRKAAATHLIVWIGNACDYCLSLVCVCKSAKLACKGVESALVAAGLEGGVPSPAAAAGCQHSALADRQQLRQRRLVFGGVPPPHDRAGGNLPAHVHTDTQSLSPHVGSI